MSDENKTFEDDMGTAKGTPKTDENQAPVFQKKPNINFNQVKEILSKKTGEGGIEERIDHPLNFNKSSWLARIIRGLEGLLLNLDTWWADIVLGLIEGVTKKGKSENVE